MNSMATATQYRHIQLDEQQVPVIAQTTMKVIELVMAQRAYGWTPEEIHINHRYLTMAQIHSALAYYWDHKELLDQDIQRREDYARQIEAQAGESVFVARLKSQGLLH